VDLLAAIHHLLTLPINEKRVEENRVHITEALHHVIDVLHILDHLKEVILRAMRN